MIYQSNQADLYHGLMSLYYSDRYLACCLAGLPMAVSDKSLALLLHHEFEKTLARAEELETLLENRQNSSPGLSCQPHLNSELYALTREFYKGSLTRDNAERVLIELNQCRAREYIALLQMAINECDDEVFKFLREMQIRSSVELALLNEEVWLSHPE